MDKLKQQLVDISANAKINNNYDEGFVETRNRLYDMIFNKIIDGEILKNDAKKGKYSSIIYSYKKNQDYFGIPIVKFFTPSSRKIKAIMAEYKIAPIHIELQNSLKDFEISYDYDRKKEKNFIKLSWKTDDKKYDLSKLLNG